ncbi:uncharacterized protein ATC70_001858 [Mucor velutinosus]|uniref:Clathrin/coatomer adaptor adaptin-like N-terminal domain-containing protein n=1 Tax=Mucor velutinosus TaxID=708070 RepID=A0AAN7HZY3_9FUNG|nr:hypothetical protein ATC70_001858 [Mucor velutinosus]
MRSIKEEEPILVFCQKMAPSLVTLLSGPPEFQYIALRNMDIVLQTYPQVLNNEMRVFFWKYNDSLYVKLEKLEILIRLSLSKQHGSVTERIKRLPLRYANEVDVEFVRRSVNAIGRCAIKIDDAAERCIHVLLDLISTGVSYVVQEAIVVIKDMFRKYPQTYECILPQLCENLDVLDEPEAKAALTWIIGEYAESIVNADKLIRFFLDNFKEENSQVQLQLLTATVKLFLEKPNENQALVQEILQVASMECDNADIRDRAYIYWRLLSTDPQAAKAVVLSEKSPIAGENQELSPALLDTLISEIGTLAFVYHKPAETFVAGKKYGADHVAKAVHKQQHMDGDNDDKGKDEAENIKQAIENNDIGDLLDLDWSDAPVVNNSPAPHTNTVLDDLLSLSSTNTTSINSSNTHDRDDVMRLFSSPPSAPISTVTTQQPAADPFAHLF